MLLVLGLELAPGLAIYFDLLAFADGIGETVAL